MQDLRGGEANFWVPSKETEKNVLDLSELEGNMGFSAPESFELLGNYFA